MKRVKNAICSISQVKVIIKYPVYRTAPAGLGIFEFGKLAGVLADQVMEGETTGIALFEQMMVKQVNDRG